MAAGSDIGGVTRRGGNEPLTGELNRWAQTPLVSREDSRCAEEVADGGPHLTVEQRLALRLKARGLSLREIGPQVGCSHELVRMIARQVPRRPVRHYG